MRITLKDVARSTGVSVYTASDILNGGDMRYSEETRRKVQEAARRLNYRQNRQARILRGAKSGLIGMLKPVSVIQTAAERGLYAAEALHKASDYDLISFDVHWHQQGLERAVDFLLSNRVEGILLVSLDGTLPLMIEAYQRLKAADIPLVSMDGTKDPEIPWVGTDYFHGGVLLGRHLISRGYSRAAFLVGEEELRFDALQKRLAGVTSALQEGGASIEVISVPIPPNPENSITLKNFLSGSHAMRKLLERKGHFDAAVCGNDYIALSAIRASKDAGLRIPEDMAVTGFDDTAIGRFSIPQLTSVSHPAQAVAEKAVEILLDKIHGTVHSKSLTIRLPCKLVVRESCGANFAMPNIQSGTTVDAR